jgi:hypothetical protein
MEEIIGDYKKFLEKVFANLDGAGVDVSSFPCDHIGFRASSEENYEEMKQKLKTLGKIIGEVTVSGRSVMVMKLEKPIIYKGYNIPCIEVLAPKEGFDYGVGLEHAEFVIDTSLENFMKKYPQLKFITKSLDRESNPEIGLMFGTTNVKFHNQPVEEVVKINS